MANENNEDLLLRIQSDVAQGAAGLQQVTDQLQNLLNVAVDTNRVLRESGRAAGEAQGGFTSLQAKIVAAHSALALLRDSLSTARSILSAVRGVTLDGAVAFGQYAQQLDNTNKQLGVSGRFYQELRLRLEGLGLGADSARQSLVFFNRSLAVAREGNTALADTFQQLRINIERVRPTEEILRDVAVRISSIEDASLRVAIASEIFGKAGAQQIPVLFDLATGSREATEEMVRLGLVLGEDAIAAGRRFDATYTQLTQTTQAFGRQVDVARAVALEPFIRFLTDGLRELNPILVAHHRELAAVAKALIALGAGATVIAGVVGLVAAVGRLRVAWQLATTAIGAYAVAQGLATGGISLLLGALATGATAWSLFRDDTADAATAQDDLADAVARATGELQAQQDRLAQQRAFAPMAAHGSALAPVSAHGSAPVAPLSAHGGTLNFTTAQLEDMRQAGMALRQVEDEAAIAAVEREEGRAAAIEERRAREIEAADRLHAMRVEQARQESTLGQISDEQRIQLAHQHATEVLAINERSGADREALTFSTGQALQALDIEQAQESQRTLVEIERAKNRARLATKQIQDDEYLENERLLLEELYQIDREAALRRLTLVDVANDPARLAEAKAAIIDLEQQHQQRIAELNAQGLQSRKRTADEERDILQQVATLESQAYGTRQQQQLAALAKAHEDFVRRLRESGHEEYIQQVDAAYAAMAERVQFGFVDLGAASERALADTFKGITAGTRDLGDVVEGFGEGLVGEFSQWMAQSLREKAGFDAVLQGNFFETIPGYAKEGAERVGQIWSNLWDFLSGGTGVGQRVTVDAGGATSPGGGSSLFTSVAALGGSAQAAQGPPNPNAPGVSTTIQGPPAPGEPGTAAEGYAASPGLSGLSSIPVVGWVIAAAQLVAEIVDGLRKGFRQARSDRWERGATSRELSGAAFSKDPLGKIWSGIFGEEIGGNINMAIMTGGMNTFMEALGVPLFQPKTTGSIVRKETAAAMREARIPQQGRFEIGGRGGARAQFLEAAPTQAEADYLISLGFDTPGVRQTQEAVGRGDVASAIMAGDPEVLAMRGGAALGLAAVWAQDLAEIVPVTNLLVNNAALTGVSVGEARREYRQLADLLGIDLVSGLETLNMRFSGGFFGEGPEATARFRTSVAGWVDLMAEDMPKAINTAALTFTAFTESGLIDIDKLQKRLEVAQQLAANLGFGEAVGASILTGKSSTLRDTLQRNYGQSVVAMVSTAINESPAFGAIFQGATTPLVEAAELFTSGDFSGANAKLATAGEAWAKAMVDGEAFMDALLEATPELRQVIEDMEAATRSAEILGGALSAALAPLIEPGSDQEAQAREARITALEYAINRAKLFGDEIKAAELEMELATERAAESASGKAGAGEAFLKAIRQGIKQEVLQGYIAGIVEAEQFKGLLAPVFKAISEGVDTVIADPSQAGAVAAQIEAAYRDVKPALDAIVAVVEQIAPVLAGGLSLGTGGVVPGALGTPVSATVHGGELVLTPQQTARAGAAASELAAMLSGTTGFEQLIFPAPTCPTALPPEVALDKLLRSVGGRLSTIQFPASGNGSAAPSAGHVVIETTPIIVQITGNTIVNDADMETLGMKAGEAMLTVLKRQMPITHRR